MEKPTIDTDNAKAGRYGEMLQYAKELGFPHVSAAIDHYGRLGFVWKFKIEQALKQEVTI